MSITAKNVKRVADKMGYDIVRGAYYGTTDDRADRWYLQDRSDVVDRRGPGYERLQLVADALTHEITHCECGSKKESGEPLCEQCIDEEDQRDFDTA